MAWRLASPAQSREGGGILTSFPGVDLTQIPLAAPVTEDKLVYLFDPTGASYRSLAMRMGGGLQIRLLGLLSGSYPTMPCTYLSPQNSCEKTTA